MQYTLADLLKVVQHALGGPPDTQLVTSTQMVNDAIDDMAYSHPWQWRQRKFSLAITATQNNVAALPNDFAGIHVAHAGVTINQAAAQYREEVLPILSGRPQKRGTYSYIIDTTPQTSATATPVQAMYIYPAPTITGVIEGVYLRTIAPLASGTSVVDVPTHFNVLVVAAVRAHCMTIEGTAGADQAMGKYQALLESFKQDDDARASNLGPKESQPA